MAITSFEWGLYTYNDYDIHLVRNGHANNPLDTLMYIRSGSTTVDLFDQTALAGLSDFDRVEFVPEVLNATYNNSTHLYSFNGVTVNKNNGAIKVSK